jgi:hypothetical protein
MKRIDKITDLFVAIIATIAPAYLGVACARVSISGVAPMWILVIAFAGITVVGAMELKKVLNRK